MADDVQWILELALAAPRLAKHPCSSPIPSKDQPAVARIDNLQHPVFSKAQPLRAVEVCQSRAERTEGPDKYPVGCEALHAVIIGIGHVDFRSVRSDRDVKWRIEFAVSSTSRTVRLANAAGSVEGPIQSKRTGSNSENLVVTGNCDIDVPG